MGIVENALALIAEAFNALSIEIETPWGLTPPVLPDRRYVQSSCSAAEQAKLAQACIPSIRAESPAHYITSRGRRVCAAGIVDDT